MELANTIIGAVGDLLVLTTLIIAGRTLASANRARRDALSAADHEARDRQRAARQARAWERETALERRWQRVERAGELVEDLYWAVEPGDRDQVIHPRQWIPLRNQLGHALVGLTSALPECSSILLAATTSMALDRSKLGREEIRRELERIDSDLVRFRYEAPA